MAEDKHPSTHPPLPPTTEDDRISWLRLLRSRRVGPTTFYRLMAEHGTAYAALDALPEIASKAGVAHYTPCSQKAAADEYRAGKQAGAVLICIGMSDYPSALLDIPDAPPVFWAKGDLALLRRRKVALVGARNASSLGLRMARTLAEELCRDDAVVVSGLARGIDTAAHKAALESGTIAVMASGIDVIYPTENTHLGHDIARSGLCLTEQAVGQVPQARHFPARNRIISGLSEAVVVVEAAAKSGSLITARTALDQGREVLAVPGHPFDARSAGCNMLIRDGATLVRGGQDIIEALAYQKPSAAANDQLNDNTEAAKSPSKDGNSNKDGGKRLPIAALHGLILDRLGPSPLAEDQLIRDLPTNATDVAPVLMDMEIKGRIKRHPGGLVSLI